MIRRNVSTIISALLMLIFVSSPAHARRPLPPEVFRIQGDSQSLASLIFPVKDLFQSETKIPLMITGELSAVKGLEEADRGLCDAIVVAMSFDKLNRLASDAGLLLRNRAMTQHFVLMNEVAYRVIVNPKNQVSKLSAKELRKIFSGQSKDWSEFNGAKEPVSIVWGEWSTGASWVMAHNIMDDEPILKNMVKAVSIADIIAKVAADPTAIGVIPSSALPPSVKAITTPELKIDGPITLVTVGFPTLKHFTLMKLIKEAGQLIGY